jgi:CRISPR-associated protein Csm3
MIENGIPTLYDKLKITGKLTLLTGMHIGASNDFAPIGAVDSIVVRDPLKSEPIIPGSTLKGKMRTLLAKATSNEAFLDEIEKDNVIIKRLFGASEPVVQSRLQFCDLFMSKDSVENLRDKTDLYLTEIKFENVIDRITAIANPRQLERVPAGAEFDFVLIYNLENLDEVEEDFDNISKSLKLLHMDYIGGSGTRGYGKIKISEIQIEPLGLTDRNYSNEIITKIEQKLNECENYDILSI